jgi:hypothetical protein
MSTSAHPSEKNIAHASFDDGKKGAKDVGVKKN